MELRGEETGEEEEKNRKRKAPPFAKTAKGRAPSSFCAVRTANRDDHRIQWSSRPDWGRDDTQDREG